jgi:hypothetical protein
VDVARDPLRHTLVVFLHPQCGCSNATVGELHALMTRLGDRIAVQVLVFRPSSAAPDWERTDVWQSVAAIPGVHLAPDVDARQARHFGALVSGQTLLYAPNGELLFSGGITFARGHAGDNDGRQAIVSAVLNSDVTTRRTPVFGCFLQDAAASSSPAIAES